MELAVITRLGELTEAAGCGPLLEGVDLATHRGRKRAILQLASTKGIEFRRRVSVEDVAGGRGYVEQLEADQLRVVVSVIAPTRTELVAIRQVIRLGLAGGLHDTAGHHVRYLGEQTVWAAQNSRLRGEAACEMFLDFEGGLYREQVVPTAKSARIIPAPEVL